MVDTNKVMFAGGLSRWLGILSVAISLQLVVGGDWNYFKCFETVKRCPNQNVSFYLYTRY